MPSSSSPTRPNSFLGPTAPWAEDDDGTVYTQVLRSTAESLIKSLEQRIKALRSEDLTEEDIVLECRRQIADCAVDGHVSLASDISDLIFDLLQAKEHKLRL